MSAFISKIQYQNYEPGEFTDEQSRSLKETLRLIRSYPWAEQRHLTDVGLTGPSVTVCNAKGDYLKLGLYFNHKYCLYYLDRSGNLYEKTEATLDDACYTIKSFFEHDVSLKWFQKRLLNWGSNKHFVSMAFAYTFNTPLYFSTLIVIAALTLVSLVVFTLAIQKDLIALLVAIMPLIGAVILNMLFKQYRKYGDNILVISKEQDSFTYRTPAGSAQYRKSDIDCVYLGASQYIRNNNFIHSYITYFKNGTSIKIPGFIIDKFTFEEKFSGNVNVE